MINLQRMLKPEHVCVVGGRDAAAAIKECRRIGYRGEIWPINPHRESIEGIPCFNSVEELPAAPDATFLAVPPEPAIHIVSSLSDIGAGGVVCYTAGFGGAGVEGGDSDQSLVTAAGNLAVVGPNCYGVINYLDKVALWPFEHGGFAPGFGAAIITQSGMLSSDITMNQRSLPLAFMVSAGNQSVLTIPDYIDALSQREEVLAIGLHIEGLTDVQSFIDSVKRCQNLNKPVVVMKSGSSRVGSALTVSHTGSLSGKNEAYQALFEKLGIIAVSDPAQLIETLKLLCVTPRPTGKTLVAFTCSGGGATMVADHCEETGLDLPEPTTATATSLRRLLPDIATVSNPLDYTTPIWGQYEKTAPVFTAALSDIACDGLTALLVQDYPHPDIDDSKPYYSTDARAFADSCKALNLPAVICSTLSENMDRATREQLIERGVAPMQGIREAISAIASVARTASAKHSQPYNLVRTNDQVTSTDSSGWVQVDEANAKALIAAHGIAVPLGKACDIKNLVETASGISAPWVLKANSGDIAHKSELGAVKLNLSSEQELLNAATAIEQTCMALNPVVSRVQLLIEQMMEAPIAELIVSVRADEQFGLVATIGSGGIFVDLIGDSVTLLLPANDHEIHAAIGRLKIARLLEGYRGSRSVDVPALISGLQRIFNFAEQHASEYAELEINPLFVYAHSQCAVDVLAYRRSGRPGGF